MIKLTPRQRKFSVHLVFVGIIVLIDQLTKQVAYDNLLGQPPMDVLPFFKLALLFNKGAAFGFLGDAGGWQLYVLSGISIVVSLLLVVWLWFSDEESPLLSWGLALVLAGAVGNLIDRVSHQYVIDFLVLHYRGWYFPAFNIADVAITFGAVVLILDIIGWPDGTATRDAKRDVRHDE